jgi:hypothetical protein
MRGTARMAPRAVDCLLPCNRFLQSSAPFFGRSQSFRASDPSKLALTKFTEDGNLKELLVPYPAHQMRMWEISPRVNSPKGQGSAVYSRK